MEIDHLATGDPVTVNLAGLYLGLCGRCAQATLVVPGGVCSACQAPESSVVRDPLLQSGHAIRGDHDDV
jgi:ribosomal protein L37E